MCGNGGFAVYAIGLFFGYFILQLIAKCSLGGWGTSTTHEIEIEM